MSKLKPSEFRLLLLFGIVAFLLANAFGYKVLTERHDAILMQKDQLEARIKTAEVYELQERESLRKEAWLNNRVPVYASETHLNTHLLQLVEARASSYQLVPELQAREPELRDGYMRSILQVKLSGEIMPLLELVFSLQDPEEFRAITSFDLKAKPKDPKTVFAEFTIEQWWNPDSPTLVANAEVAPLEAPAPSQPATTGGGGVQHPATKSPVPVPLQGVTSGDGTSLPLPLSGNKPAAPVTPPPGPEADLPVLKESANEEKPK